MRGESAKALLAGLRAEGYRRRYQGRRPSRFDGFPNHQGFAQYHGPYAYGPLDGGL